MDRRTTPWLTAAGAVGALGLGFVAGLLGGHVGSSGSGAPGSCDATAVSRTTLPAIVTVSARSAKGSGTGSGEIVRADGYIVTNNHVISVAATNGKLDVLLSDGEELPATLVGRDPQTDLAVLHVKPEGSLPIISFADSTDLDVGQPVVALGAPLGLSGSVTQGIVSALGRDVPVPSDNDSTTVLTDAVQTDAAINPGNSGGALVDCNSRLVGVNTAIATVPNAAGEAGGGSVGIGFAVPSDTVKAITSELIDHGSVAHPSLGMTASTVTPQTAARFGVTPGLYVETVTPGGPAAKAGLKSGDIVTKLNGQPALATAQLTNITVHASVGDTVDVEYLRDGTSHTTTVTMEAIAPSEG